MAPLITLQILGLISLWRSKRQAQFEEEAALVIAESSELDEAEEEQNAES
jgi:cbb3-type cytochrome oxidase subunit 3